MGQDNKAHSDFTRICYYFFCGAGVLKIMTYKGKSNLWLIFITYIQRP